MKINSRHDTHKRQKQIAGMIQHRQKQIGDMLSIQHKTEINSRHDTTQDRNNTQLKEASKKLAL